MNFRILPEQASHVAAQTDHLYWALLILSAGIVLIVGLPIVYFLFKYRASKKVDRRLPHLPEIKIEVAWTVIPALIMTGLFVWGAEQYFIIERPPADAMEINVVGKQWMWKLQHPEGNREINELHVPVGRAVKLVMTSQDVIHSFFLPSFRIKQDVVPGRYTSEWFKANRKGVFPLFCSEYCGTSHSRMIGRVVVMDPVDYADWLARGQPGATLAQDGERLYRELGCSGCHSGSTVVRAPPLAGLFGNPVPLNDGKIVTADEAYIRDSILQPGKEITGGYTNDMPAFVGRVNEEQIMELIAYIKSIGGQRLPEANSNDSTR